MFTNKQIRKRNRSDQDSCIKLKWLIRSGIQKFIGLFTIIYFVLIIAVSSLFGAESGFNVRGTIPWHNFLSGPSAWNEGDYLKYLDRLKEFGLNTLVFHCYTGGGERYVTYVEPIIKIEYKNVIPDCFFDTSLTARWGYRPLPVSKFAFDSGKVFNLPQGIDAFGADCALFARDKEERYARAQALMRKVISLAHERGIKVGIGFEFGIHPPEFASVVPPSSWIRGVMLPDPTHPASIEILRKTIDNILENYPDIDMIWLWLHEFSMDVVRPYASTEFRDVYRRDWQYFQDAQTEETVFTGVWALSYIRLAYEYIVKKAPKVRVVISGWGNKSQLPSILAGLDRALPLDIVFTCLNPNQGWEPQPQVLEDIAKHRIVWAIPWLEGDARLWHLQPRVRLMREQVTLAKKQKLDGVLAIHWRTEETRANLEAFASYAANPDASQTVQEFYKKYCEREFGKEFAQKIAEKLVWYDINQEPVTYSPEYYPYDVVWGLIKPELKERLQTDIAELKQFSQKTSDKNHKANIDWLIANFEFTLLLDETSRAIEPAQRLRDDFLRGRIDKQQWKARFDEAKAAFEKAPIESLFKVYSGRVRSRGELGVLSSLNQKLWLHYLDLKNFLQKEKVE
ncbi:MAG: hypothetical protein ACP5T0_11305 [Verrucomicrobiia bacterium]